MGKPNTITYIEDAIGERFRGKVYVQIHAHAYEESPLHYLLLAENPPDEIIIPEDLLSPPIGLAVIATTLRAASFNDPEAEGGRSLDYSFYARKL